MYTESMENKGERYQVIEIQQGDKKVFAVRDNKLSTDLNADGTHNPEGALYVVTYEGGMPMVMELEWVATELTRRLNSGDLTASNLVL